MAFGAGRLLTAQYLNDTLPPSESDTQTTAGTTISTAYVTTLTSGAVCGTDFIAPLSGKATILFYGKLRNSGANITLMSPRIATGSTVDAGTLVQDAGDNTCLQHSGTADEAASGHVMLSGLTPGAAYNVVLRHRVTAGTGTFTSRAVAVILPI